uniref:VWFD domain-containing protein n=1 Tax=Branchiostoma floridae TaxID=7739 RepID=C3YM82_BRAFL|eukprot:XP_002602664.1 hypothetical protein BRAFLDRAFT_72968 [Branchiostoma floridae]
MLTARAICRAYGDPHYYTFDGELIHYQGHCTYRLAQNCRNESLPYFNVEAENEARGNPSVTWVTAVYLDVFNVSVAIKKNKVVFVDLVQVTPPVDPHPEVRVRFSGTFVTIETDFGLKVSFDGWHHVEVILPETYRSATCGICGNYNGISADDYLTSNGTLAGDAMTFGDSWRVPKEGDGDRCDVTTEPECEGELQDIATRICGILRNPDSAFEPCFQVLSPEPSLLTCVYDVCALIGDTVSLCTNLQAYADACAEAGVNVGAWRNSSFCPLPCPANSQYNPCSSACPATCTDVSAPDYCNRTCVESCECEPGYVLSGQNCVLREQCGCTRNGRYYMVGDSWGEDCDRRCTCVSRNNIQCTDVSCHADAYCGIQNGVQGCHCNPGYVGNGTICEASGDPHYCTLDGRTHHFQGPCRYTFAKDCSDSSDFNVEVQNMPLSISPPISITRAMYVEVYGYSISITAGRSLKVDGVTYTPPVTLGMGEVQIFLSGGFLVVQTDFGLEASFDGYHYAKVFIPGEYSGVVCGLCGNLNGDPNDDFLTSYNTTASDWTEFGDSWLTDSSSASGDPHYYPFDGGAHHFQGPCRYILAKDCGNSSDFTVMAQNVPIWPGAGISVVREVFVEAHGFVVGIHQGKAVTVGGVPHTLPFSLAGGTVEVSLSGRFVRVFLSNFSVEVLYDGSHEVQVEVPGDYSGQMCGLCGNYNGDTSDDYMTPDGTVVGDWNTFGNSWLTNSDTCPGGPQPTPPPPCNDAVHAAAESVDNCGLLTNAASPFGVCHGTVDPERFFTSCVFDMCALSGDTVGLCQNLEAYAAACRAAGVAPFSWRTEGRCLTALRPARTPTQKTIVPAVVWKVVDVILASSLVDRSVFQKSSVAAPTMEGVTTRNYWIGLDDLNSERQFVWNDGTPLGSYHKFRSSSPHKLRDCVALWRTGKLSRWYILSCRDRLPFICQTDVYCDLFCKHFR